MKAAAIQETGSFDNLKILDLPTPKTEDTQLKIRVHYSSINPIDTYIRSGMIPMPIPIPFIPGCDFSGEVIEIGKNVSGFQLGERVWGSNQGLLGRQGTLAEEIVVDECFVYKTPENVSDQEAAAFSLVGITAAIGLIERGNLKENESIFVNGGSGAIGNAVIQMARAIGAQVYVSTSTQQKMDHCLNAGVTDAVNYNDPDWFIQLKEIVGEGVDMFWETSREPDFFNAVHLLKEHGRMIIMAGRDAKPEFPVGPFYVKGCSLHGFAMFKESPETQRKCAEKINSWLESGQITPNIAQTFPLDEAAKGHELQEKMTLQGGSGHFGKILVQVKS